MERLLAERGRDLRVRDQLQLDRKGPDAEALGQVVGLADVADVLDLRPGAAVDALGVLDVVDRGQRDDLVVQRDREALEAVSEAEDSKPGLWTGERHRPVQTT